MSHQAKTVIAKSRVLVRGVGEIASAVAWLLHRTGAPVALHTDRPPVTLRRTMAFSDAAFHGSAVLEGVTARRLENVSELAAMWDGHQIPVLFCDFHEARNAVQWDVLVDARMNKRSAPERQTGMAPLVIGLGPGCSTGDNVDIAIETSWEDLGRVLTQGSTLPLRGEPRAILGHGRERFRYSPVSGIFAACHRIGDVVLAGAVIAQVGDTPIVAPIDGLIRGLPHDGVLVEVGDKIAEIDPRRDGAPPRGINERPRRLAEAVTTVVTGQHLSAMASAFRRRQSYYTLGISTNLSAQPAL